MSRKSRIFYVIALVLIAVFAITGCSGGSDSSKDAKDTKKAAEVKYPERSIDGVVGWGAGGGTDVFARAIAKSAADIMKKPLPVKNMPGSSGAIAGDYVMQQPADGYTIWFMGSNYAVNVALGRTPHTPDAYIQIARIQHDLAMLQVTKESKYKTIDDLIADAKKRPGEIKLGGTGAASFDEVAIALLEEYAGVKFNYIPYESAGQMHAALFGGHIDVMFEEIGPVAGRVADGSAVPILAFTDKKIAQFPNLPTAVEKGWNVTLGNWRGVMVKKGTDPAIVKILEDIFTKAKDDAAYKKVEKETYLDLRPGYLNGADFRVAMDKDIAIYKDILKKRGYVK